MASHPKSKTPELKIYQAKTLLYKNLKSCFTPAQKGHVGGDRRLTGRLPAHHGSQRLPTVSDVLVRRTGLPVQGTPIRPVHGSESFHESRGSSSLLPQKERGHPIRLPRRLASGRELSVRSCRQRTKHAPNPPRTGLDRQRMKVSTDSNPDDSVLWGDIGLSRPGCSTLRREDHCGQDDHAANHLTSGVTNTDVAPSPGTHG
ncbi:hypothetical protein BSL78_23504 [Apostichopus japonicus]|uniref:Uncharacterized protein n=1 Tax=Stichopus japonicus TaxID=307972 RepID=A0A2G8JVB0_STIJA|nr:hypothetical protein BSL78_23504 [Apostichopus japonicus]